MVAYKTEILLVIIVLYVVYTIYAQVKIIKSTRIGNKRKFINSIMIWIVPFIWYSLVKGLIVRKTKVMTKKEREKIRRKNTRGFDGGFYAG